MRRDADLDKLGGREVVARKAEGAHAFPAGENVLARRALHPARYGKGVNAANHPGDNIRANGTSQKWTSLRMLPESGSIP
jgi:hypothetical protein